VTVDKIPDDAGWWVAGIGPAYEQALRGLTAPMWDCAKGEGDRAEGAGRRARRGDVREWVSLGRARPAETLEALAAKGIQAPAAVKGLSRVEMVEWSLEMTEGNAMSGEVTLVAVKK
jgi:hypothetical protein